MVKTKAQETLYVLMNGRLVGLLHRATTGAMKFQYAEEWLETSGARPLSLSLPLRSTVYEGQQVYNFFDNLLPDNKTIRDRMQTRFQTSTNQPFDLLSAAGSDCVGAVQLCHQLPGPNIKTVSKQVLTESDVAKLLRGYKMSPLGMTKEVDNFRISIAGAQEKTALLRHNQTWCLPTGPTPTSHIFKLPIGVIGNNDIDLSESCENEWLCLKIAEAFGFPVAKADIHIFEDVKVLVVERFDRKWSKDGNWLMRLPQEDMCQALGVAPSRKYQSDGGPGIVEIMKVLLGSKQAKADREQFFKVQILFWLLAATDGHAKNFSIYLEPSGSYRLTPLYDVISIFPLMASQTIPKQKVKMAMALKGKKNRYEWLQIQPRYFLTTAKAANFSQKQAMSLLLEMLEKTESIAKELQNQLPKEFPTHISRPIFDGMVSLASQHLPTLYQMIAKYAEDGDHERAISFYKKAVSVKTEIGDEPGKVALLSCIANLYDDQDDIDQAIEYHTQSLDIATQYNNLRNKAATLHALADIYYKQGKFEHAILFYKQSLELEEQIEDDKGKAATLHQIASICNYQGKFKEALSLYQKSFKLEEKIGDEPRKAANLNQMANIHTAQGQMDEALSLHERSLEIAESIGDERSKAATLHNMAIIHTNKGDIDTALSLYEKSLDIERQIKDLQGEASTLRQIANIYAQRGELDMALSLCEKSLSFAEETEDLQIKVTTLQSIADIYHMQEQGELALSLYEQALEIAQQTENIQMEAAILMRMGQLYANYFGQPRAALSYLQKSRQILRQINSPDAETAENILSQVRETLEV